MVRVSDPSLSARDWTRNLDMVPKATSSSITSSVTIINRGQSSVTIASAEFEDANKADVSLKNLGSQGYRQGWHGHWDSFLSNVSRWHSPDSSNSQHRIQSGAH